MTKKGRIATARQGRCLWDSDFEFRPCFELRVLDFEFHLIRAQSENQLKESPGRLRCTPAFCEEP